MESRIILAGFGGQGIMLAGQLLGQAMVDKGGEAVFLPQYGPEQRGGTASCKVIVSDTTIYSPIISEGDVLFAFNTPSLQKFEGNIKSGGMILVDSTLCKKNSAREDVDCYQIPATDMAGKLGSEKTANIILLGVYLELTGMVNERNLINVLSRKLSEKPQLLETDKRALQTGREFARTIKLNRKG